MDLTKNRDLYETRHVEVDGSIYYWHKNDVFPSSDNAVNSVIKSYEKRYNSACHYYIKGCYLYFTYYGRKYFYTFVSSEILQYVKSLCAALMGVGCHDFYFNEGEVD